MNAQVNVTKMEKESFVEKNNKEMLAKRGKALVGVLRARKNTQQNLNMTATKDIAEENRCGDIKETAMGRGIEQEMAKTTIRYELGKHTNKLAGMASGGTRGMWRRQRLENEVKGVSGNAVMKEVVERCTNVDRGGHGGAGGEGGGS